MTSDKTELLEYVKDNDVKFVKLTFCDLLGRQRNISVLSSQLEDAFDNGVAIASSAMTGVDRTDLKLVPVSSLLSVLPWRPHTGRVISVFCNIANEDGTPYTCDPMILLAEQVKKLKQLGFTASVATECEFYVFNDDPTLDYLDPVDRADYCACAPFDKCENLRREVIHSLEDMGLKPISSHHERGMGQNEIDFESANPLSAARNFVMFKSAVKNVCALNGMKASFMPRPMSDQPGSGLHLSVTLSGKNADKATAAFAEGVLRRYKEITCFANPTLNSYKRLGSGYKISYSDHRRAAMRIFDDNVVQLRSPDSTCNIFTVLARVFAAGREGIEQGLTLRERGVIEDTLFSGIDEAVEFAAGSEWLHKQIPDRLDEVLETISMRSKAAAKLKTDLEFFDFYADI